MQNTMTTTGFVSGDRIQESGVHSDHRPGTVKSAQNGGTAVWVSWDEFTTREGHRLESRMGWQCVDHIELIPVEAVQETTMTDLAKTAASKKSFYTGKPYNVSKTMNVTVAYTYFVREGGGERWNVCMNAWDDDWALFASFNADETSGGEAKDLGKQLAEALGVPFIHD